ncbi:hypothetical protein PO909_014733 [Leuciscus waleckii]
MDTATHFIELAREDLSILDYSACFFRLAARKNFNDETLKSLCWTGASYYSLSDLPDMTEGTWRKVILRCLVLTAIAELETAVRPASDPEPTPIPTAEPEHEATSVQEPKVAAKPDQLCVPTSTYEPVGNGEELEEDDSLPPLIPTSPKPSSPLVLSSTTPFSPLVPSSS